MLPMIRNFLPCSTSWATYSRKREKGGLVTTMSACLSNSTHSALRKSPPSARGVGVELEVGFDLFLDVDILGVELVLFGRLRGAQISIHRLAFRFRPSLLRVCSRDAVFAMA